MWGGTRDRLSVKEGGRGVEESGSSLILHTTHVFSGFILFLHICTYVHMCIQNIQKVSTPNNLQP